MLLSFPGFIAAYPDYIADVKSTLEFITNLETANGNYPCAMDETGADK
jgi:hypothetical protein